MPDSDLKARHRKMWASGDYPSMVDTFLLPLGPRLVAQRRSARACGARRGGRHRQRLTRRPRARREDDRQRPHARALRRGPRPRRGRGSGARLGRGRRRAPAVRRRVLRRRHVLDRRDVRAPPPGGGRRAGARLPPRRHDRAAELDAGGHDRRAVSHDGPVRAAAPARRPAAAAVGQRGPRARAVRRPREWGTLERGAWTSSPSTSRASSRDQFKAHYGPTIVARANAAKDGRESEFDAALDDFRDE